METTIKKEETQELVIIAKENNLAMEVSNELLNKFSIFLNTAKSWKEKAMAIKVTSIDQVEEMLAARKARICIRDVRTNTERTRKALKENSVRYGKAVDGMANIIKAIIEPIEEHLEEQEKFLAREQERLRTERLEKIELKRIERQAELTKIESIMILPNLGEMEEQSYQEILNFSLENFNKKIAEKEAEEKRKAEELRIKKETEEKVQKEAEELAEKQKQERIKIAVENAKLKKEAKIKEDERKAKEKELQDKINIEIKEKERLLKIESDRKEAEELKKQAELKKLEEEKQWLANLGDNEKIEIFINLSKIEIPSLQNIKKTEEIKVLQEKYLSYLKSVIKN